MNIEVGSSDNHCIYIVYDKEFEVGDVNSNPNILWQMLERYPIIKGYGGRIINGEFKRAKCDVGTEYRFYITFSLGAELAKGIRNIYIENMQLNNINFNSYEKLKETFIKEIYRLTLEEEAISLIVKSFNDYKEVSKEEFEEIYNNW